MFPFIHRKRGCLRSSGTIMTPRFALSAIALAVTSLAHAAPTTYPLDDIVVTATRTPLPDSAAPYASEVYTRAMIAASGANSLVDFLAQNTTLDVMPSYGNKFTPLLDMRGYGLSSGFQNIVVSLDGQRLNNIDGMPQLLGAIPVASIDRIEITRGSGSVVYGDGATAGTIQIYTRPYQGVTVGGSAGNYGALSATVAAGLSKDNFSVSASNDYQSQRGTSDADINGQRDASSLSTQRGQVRVRPVDALWLTLDGSSSKIDTRYVGPLSLAQFNADPAQNGGNVYTHQKFDTDQWRLGAELALSANTKLTASRNREDKLSNYISPYPFKANYDYTTDDVALVHSSDAFKLTTGVQRFDGTRIGSSNRTSKNNIGYYVQGQYVFGKLTISAGARREKVDYNYVPNGGSALSASEKLNAWDIGSNYRLSADTSFFANYNQAFQAPDIDRFFNFNGSFNGFISPEKVKTVTLGVNHTQGNHRVKLAVFRADLKNEIYFNPVTFENTNIDKSHKYGLELQDNWRIRPDLSLRLGYTYTRAIIDHEDRGAGAFDGKELPGVPRHGATLAMQYDWSEHSTLNTGYVWRSDSYAANDFANNFSQKQKGFQSANLAYRYRYKAYEVSAAIDNVFAHKNGLWISDDVIYPVSFARLYRVGFKASF
jgi:iron complex outermembrane receptor protein